MASLGSRMKKATEDRYNLLLDNASPLSILNSKGKRYVASPQLQSDFFIHIQSGFDLGLDLYSTDWLMDSVDVGSGRLEWNYSQPLGVPQPNFLCEKVRVVFLLPATWKSSQNSEKDYQDYFSRIMVLYDAQFSNRGLLVPPDISTASKVMFIGIRRPVYDTERAIEGYMDVPLYRLSGLFLDTPTMSFDPKSNTPLGVSVMFSFREANWITFSEVCKSIKYSIPNPIEIYDDAQFSNR